MKVNPIKFNIDQLEADNESEDEVANAPGITGPIYLRGNNQFQKISILENPITEDDESKSSFID